MNHVKDNIPMKANINFMADLLELPSWKGYRYLFVIVDLATDKFDMEPMKTKSSDTALKALEKCFKRGIIAQPEAGSIRTDAGTEFKSSFDKFLYNNNIVHRVAVPDRHKQLANINNLHNTLGRLFNGTMNAKEVATGKTNKNWVDAIPIIRKDLNEIREKKLPMDDYIAPLFNSDEAGKPKFNVGEKVYYLSDTPLDALGNKQNTKNFRTGDRRWSKDKHEIKQIFCYANPSQYRYYLEGMPNVSFTQSEIKL
jgi:hypothetical protein